MAAVPATAHAPEHAQHSAQPGHTLPNASDIAEAKQCKAEEKAKKSKRQAEAAPVGPEAGPSSGAAEAEPRAGKRKKPKLGCDEGSLTNGHSGEGPQSAGRVAADGGGSRESGDTEHQPLKPEKQKKQEHSASATLTEAGGSPSGARVAGDRSPSWAKLAKEILASCEGHRMKLAKLQRKVVAAAGLPKQAVADHQSAIVQRLNSKRKTFAMTDGEVSLKIA